MTGKMPVPPKSVRYSFDRVNGIRSSPTPGGIPLSWQRGPPQGFFKTGLVRNIGLFLRICPPSVVIVLSIASFPPLELLQRAFNKQSKIASEIFLAEGR